MRESKLLTQAIITFQKVHHHNRNLHGIQFDVPKGDLRDFWQKYMDRLDRLRTKAYKRVIRRLGKETNSNERK